jgi:hypothetical protein
MASTYSTNLGIELLGSGEQSGTWGTTTNNMELRRLLPGPLQPSRSPMALLERLVTWLLPLPAQVGPTHS